MVYPCKERAAVEKDHRRLWKQNRVVIEGNARRSTPLGMLSHHEPGIIKHSVTLFGAVVRRFGLYRYGFRNALDIHLNSFQIAFADLPDEFDGYRILHLTDFHLDMAPGLDAAIISTVRGHQFDLCVMTGDYQNDRPFPLRLILDPMAKIAGAVRAEDGIYATLGNHDDHRMAKGLERLGIRVLVNESVSLERNGARLHITGLDDVNRFFTPMAHAALTPPGDDFKIALVHSPEMANEASRKGYSLYLCGHTHGGQVCLPGGRPIMTRLIRDHRFVSGWWKCGDMTGYTSPGIGASGVPVRFFSRGEATLITLKKKTPK
ncbi:MAG: hypothetical protein A3G18_11950 [Rhodospirillales bacterium RIFCSPLOWO2_12_FULL_58_28]|nr:MAG: hypothetical protein A3H92_09035 [Rhodospirillales bacterium RIFCSPLOWO2_02_FULL_58_16]OHC78154.1 MAG: hypothetical protein A3G18_11950 [Rhodospirillales bacterium RIFCSPLOWO2_12_FULL_58_28]